MIQIHAQHKLIVRVVDIKERVKVVELIGGIRLVRQDGIWVIVAVVVGFLDSIEVSGRLLAHSLSAGITHSQSSIRVLELRHVVYLRRELDITGGSDDAELNNAIKGLAKVVAAVESDDALFTGRLCTGEE